MCVEDIVYENLSWFLGAETMIEHSEGRGSSDKVGKCDRWGQNGKRTSKVVSPMREFKFLHGETM